MYLEIKREVQERPKRYRYDILHTTVTLVVENDRTEITNFGSFISRHPTKFDNQRHKQDAKDISDFIDRLYAALCMLNPNVMITYV